MSEMLYPSAYRSTLLPIDDLFARHEGDLMHPEFRRRFTGLIVASDGLLGIGGGWRSTEQQAANYARDPKGFAPPGESFHEPQRFASGIVGFQAVDTVGRDGRHSEAWAWMRANEARFGLRSFWNINDEPWHVQCFDIPLSVKKWKAAGRPDPSPSFRLPGAPVSPPEVQPPPPVEEDDTMEVIRVKGDTAQYLRQGMFARWIPAGNVKTAWVDQLGFDPAVVEVPLSHLGNLILVGANPYGTGVTTSPADFGGHIA